MKYAYLQQIQDPFNELSPDYKECYGDWFFLDMIYRGGWMERDRSGMLQPTSLATEYFPKEPAEADDSWLRRYQKTPYEDRYRQTIRQFVALLWGGGCKIEDAPPQIWMDKLLVDPREYALVNPFWDNVDGKGTNGDQFTKSVAYKALAFGLTFVFVDWTGDRIPVNRLDASRSSFRPKFVSVDVFDFVHFEFTVLGGTEVLSFCTIRSESGVRPSTDLPIQQATSNWKQESRTYTLEPKNNQSLWVRWELRSRTDPNMKLGEVEEQGYIDLPYIPLVPIYSGEVESFLKCKAPLFSIAQLNLLYYQMSGDLYRYIKICLKPIPVIVNGDEKSPVVISPEKPIYVESGGSLIWAEPSGSSISQIRAELSVIDGNMQAIESNWLMGAESNQTAFLTAVQATATDSGLEIFADQLTSGINRILAIASDYFGLVQKATLLLNAGVGKKLANDSAKIDRLFQLFDRALLTPQAFLRLLREIGFLPDSIDGDSEVAQMSAGKPKWTVPIDAAAYTDLLHSVMSDVITKRQFLTECVARGWFSNQFDIDKAIAETGEKISLAQVGLNQVQPFDESTIPGTAAWTSAYAKKEIAKDVGNANKV